MISLRAYIIPKKRREEWGCARKIAEIPNYMYPGVTFKNSPVKLKMEV